MEDINLKSDEPLVSIVMPLYNYGRFLEASVDSVLAQKYKNWELIIVDDCSTDDSYPLALDIANRDDRIKVFRLFCGRVEGGARTHDIQNHNLTL